MQLFWRTDEEDITHSDMGIDRQLFDSPVDDELLCKICQERPFKGYGYQLKGQMAADAFFLSSKALSSINFRTQDVLEDPRQIPECEHLFCQECISEWRRRQNTCPIDRKDIRGKELVKVVFKKIIQPSRPSVRFLHTTEYRSGGVRERERETLGAAQLFAN